MSLRGPLPPKKAVGNKYLEERVATASPAQLVGMLFEAAVANVKLGIVQLENGDRAAAGKMFQKAQDITLELRASLNREEPELSNQLDSIYAWVYQNLVTAVISSNKTRSTNAAKEALRCLEPIAEAWAEAARNTQ